jgi:putative transposase
MKILRYPNKKLIYYSDRRFQYCKTKYTENAESSGNIMRMTEQYDPYGNAITKRINRTLKNEYGLKQIIKNVDVVKKNN